MEFVVGRGAVEAGGAMSCASLLEDTDSFFDLDFVLFFSLAFLAMLRLTCN